MIIYPRTRSMTTLAVITIIRRKVFVTSTGIKTSSWASWTHFFDTSPNRRHFEAEVTQNRFSSQKSKI